MLAYDPDVAHRHIVQHDARLGHIIEHIGAFKLHERKLTSPFVTLLRSITGQQLSVKAAATIFGRVQALMPDGLTPEALLSLPEEALRSAGLSRAKTASVRDLAAKVLDGTVPSTVERLAAMPDEAIVEALTRVRGIGRWTVEMLLLFHLGRPDVLPATDLGIRNGFQKVYALPERPTPSAILKHGERWRPYRSVASWYLWRAVDLDVAL